jgi:hypothetical protein
MTPDHTAWQIFDGRIKALTLPQYPDWYYLPEGVTSPASDGALAPVHLIPGEHHEDYESFTLPIIAEIAIRCTPWATWYLSPKFFDCASYGGKTWREAEIAICHTTSHPPFAISTAYHEAWHLAEWHLRPDLLAALDARLATGPDWPGDYYPRPCERRARAFSYFAMSLIEGCRAVVAGPAAPIESQIFWLVYSGTFGREMIAARSPKRGIIPRAMGLLTS